MSDLAAGIPIGMSIGIGAGIGIGKKIGQKEIAKKITELSSNHEISIKKPDGNFMAIVEFINILGIAEESAKERKSYNVLLLAGIIVFVLAVVIYFLII